MYNKLAEIYDILQRDIDYEHIADIIEEIFVIHSSSPHLILDLGCGTGNITTSFAKRGYDMLGIDISAEMLNVAVNKNHSSIQYINQDMTNFELYGTVDAIVSILDNVNYIIEKKKLKRFVKLCFQYLNPNGILIFDVNSQYKFENVFGNNTFISDENGIFYTWRNNYDKRSGICEFDLTFFVNDGNGNYIRSDELQYQRCYKKHELHELLSKYGKVKCFDGFSLKPAKKNSERLLFAVQKK